MFQDLSDVCGLRLTNDYIFICWRHPNHIGPHVTISAQPEETFAVSLIDRKGQCVPLHPVYRDMISAAARSFDTHAHAD